MRTTVRHVAEYCGMAASSARDILGERGHLYSEKTRQRVWEAARKLGYCPNASARAMRRRRYNAHSLVMGCHSGESFLPSRLLAALDIALSEHGLALHLRHVHEHELTGGGVRETVQGLSVDGFFVNYLCRLPEVLLEIIRKNRLPRVFLNRREPVNAVHPDDRGDLARLTRRLIDAGHRRIAYFNPFQYAEGDRHYSHDDRRDGYLDAMREAGSPPHLVPAADGNGPVAIAGAVHQLLTSATPPGAVVTYGWEVGATVLSVARTLGLSLPRDLAVSTVFANEEFADPGFAASLWLDWESLARRAVAMQEALVAAGGDGSAERPSQAVPGLIDGDCPPPAAAHAESRGCL